MRNILRIAWGDFRDARRYPPLYLYLVLTTVATLLLLDKYEVKAAQELGKMFHRGEPLPHAYVTLLLANISTILPLIIADLVARTSCSRWRARMNEWAKATRSGARTYVAASYLGILLLGSVIYCAPLLITRIVALIAAPSLLRPYNGWMGGVIGDTLVLQLPNAIISGAILFAIGLATSRASIVYLIGILMVAASNVAEFVPRLRGASALAMVDPTGESIVRSLFNSLTQEHKLFQSLPTTGELIFNRLAWLVISAAALLLASTVFRRSQRLGQSQRRPASGGRFPPNWLTTKPIVSPQSSNALAATVKMVRVAVFEFSKSAWLWIFMISTMIYVLTIALRALGIENNSAGTVYPTLYRITNERVPWFAFGTIIVALFCAGVFVWQSRALGFRDILDSSPVRSLSFIAASILGVLCVLGCMMLLSMAAVIGVQLIFGTTPTDLSDLLQLYFGIFFINAAVCAVIAVAIHALSGQKLTGYIISILVVCAPMMIFTGFDSWGSVLFYWAFSWRLSGIDGFIPSLVEIRWFQAYWLFVAVSLAVIGASMWPRGSGLSFFRRALCLRANASLGLRIVMAVTLTLVSAIGVANFPKLSRRAKELAPEEISKRWANYESRFKPYENAKLLTITAVQLECQIFTKQRRVDVRGKYSLHNYSTAPINSVVVRFPYYEMISTRELKLGATGISLQDPSTGTYAFTPQTAIAPDGSVDFEFNYSIQQPDFLVGYAHIPFWDNSTHLIRGYFPKFGYDHTLELRDNKERRKHRLPPHTSVSHSKPNDTVEEPHFQQDFKLRSDIAVTVDSGQTAIAPGALLASSEENGRRSFLYQSDSSGFAYPYITTGRYSLKVASWNDVKLEIYYNPQQGYNIDYIFEATRRSLEYASKAFGPYKHQVFRIIQAYDHPYFAGWSLDTLAFLSENGPFIARNANGLQGLFSNVAHEVAHQWWGWSVVAQPGSPGEQALMESLAEYTAMMIMKHERGSNAVRRFLAGWHRVYLDNHYALGSAELPLASQPFSSDLMNQKSIIYEKGALAFYALEAEIGEIALNRALANIVHRYSYAMPPSLTFSEVLAELRKVTPPDAQHMLFDLFQSVVTYDARILSANSRYLGDGKWEVAGTLALKKWRLTDARETVDATIDDVIDIAVYARDGRLLGVHKHRVHSNESDFTFNVQGIPERVTANPDFKLIETDLNNNSQNVHIDRVPPYPVDRVVCAP